jgi:hypothetical protein
VTTVAKKLEDAGAVDEVFKDNASRSPPQRRDNRADRGCRRRGVGCGGVDRCGISREGSVELRRAIVELGRDIGLPHPDFIGYRHQLLSRGKPPLVAMIAVGHRAHRLAFAMLRSQQPYDADRWTRAVAGHRYPTDEQARHGGTTATGGPPARRDLPA